MIKLELSEIIAVLQENKIEPEKVKAIEKTLEKVAAEIAQDKAANATPKAKNDYLVVLVSDDPELAKKELTAFVVTQPAESDAGTLLTRIGNAAKSHNLAQKRKKNIVKNLSEALMYVKRKFSKSQDYLPKSKEAVRVIISSNILS